MQELEEKTLAHYTILRRLARGGMSHVYLACDQQTGHTVAIKVVHRNEDDYFAHFQREVKILSSLTHEHILPVIDSGAHGLWYYCVTPYIEHGTLRERLTEGPLTQEEAGSIFQQIASALQFAHERGILHRDIKPSNILLGDGQHVYLADFGLAKNIRERSTVTQSGCLIGTPEYMAPELAEEPATTSSDIYALGILLYQLLTGRVPFKGSTPLSIYWKHIKEQAIPPSQLNPAVSYPVEQLVLHALQKEPRHRFKTVQAMAQAYARSLQASDEMKLMQLQNTAATITLPAPTQRVIAVSVPVASSHRYVHPALATLIAVFFFAIPLALGFTMSKDSISPQAPMALGASARLTKINGTLHEMPPIHRPALSNVQASSQQGSEQSISDGDGNGGEHQHGYGHKHGHKHDD